MTRIVAGSAKGRRLEVPKSGTRPTSERTREAVFSHLEHQGVIAGATVLDLYAGSGALGLEAASRGAGRVYLVEKHPAAAKLCRLNAKNIGLGGSVEVVTAAVLPFLNDNSLPVELIFADPPYDIDEAEVTELCRRVSGLLTEDGIFILERAKRNPEPTWPEGLLPYVSKKYGDSIVWFCEKA